MQEQAEPEEPDQPMYDDVQGTAEEPDQAIYDDANIVEVCVLCGGT